MSTQNIKNAFPALLTAEVVSLGWFEEDQRVILGVGRHVGLHQHQPAVAAGGAQRLGLLCLPGEGPGCWFEGQPLHVHHRRPHL